MRRRVTAGLQFENVTIDPATLREDALSLPTGPEQATQR
jgi:hypothetical protein